MTTPKNPVDALAAFDEMYDRLNDLDGMYSWKDEMDKIRAALTPKPSGGGALDYFMKNVDGRTTLDIFKSMVTAMKNADAACVAGDDIKQDTWFNIAKCEMMDLCREHSRVIEAALTPSPDYVMVPRGPTREMIKSAWTAQYLNIGADMAMAENLAEIRVNDTKQKSQDQLAYEAMIAPYVGEKK